MKLIIRDYLASLKEREELDAILPDLLSELGFTVFSRPRRGTVQHGVDIAAVGNDEDGERKVFLFSVKQGDLTRQDWDGTPQGLRSSLNAIRDVYIRSRVPRRFADMKIVVCLCFGGDVHEQVQEYVTGYIYENTTGRISFDEWNGDKIAGLLLRGILREEVLPKPLRASFQKAVAMVDEPDVAYQHFASLVHQLRTSSAATQRARVRAARQIYVCLWILFVWARDAGTVEAPYRASELALLNVWHLLRPFIGKRTNDAKAIVRVHNQLIELHLLIAGDLLKKVLPHVRKRHALSVAVESRSFVDINLKLFDLLGRLGMSGLWAHWDATSGRQQATADRQAGIAELVEDGFRLINNNPALLSPIMDQHAIEIAIFLLFAIAAGNCRSDIAKWLGQVVAREDLALRTHGRYFCIFTAYRDLLGHPRDRSDAYRKEATAGSTLIPLLSAWLSAFGDRAAMATLVNLKRDVLEHCTLQLWLPDKSTEDELYAGGRAHGVALTDLPLSGDGRKLIDTVAEACAKEDSFATLSAIQTGYWPIVLLACRHYRLPVPPQFWIGLLDPAPPSADRSP
jgi:hypothetical protein